MFSGTIDLNYQICLVCHGSLISAGLTQVQITVHMSCLVNVFKIEMRFIMKILTGFCFVVSVVGVRVHLNELQCAEHVR